MSITWFSDESKDIYVTLTPIHITINKAGLQFFDSAYQVMLGYDKAKNVIIIKPLSKDDVTRGDIPEHAMYNISISSTYARITNKAFITKVIEIFNLNLDEKGSKYKARWRVNSGVLEVELKGVE